MLNYFETRQIHGRVVRLPLRAGNHPRFGEARPCLARRMSQWNEHLAAAQHRRAHVVLRDRVAARELAFIS